MSRRLLPLVAALNVLCAMPAAATMLPVPPNLIALDSQQGRRLLLEATTTTDFYPLSEQFVTQKTQAFCGVASLVMVLNALQMPAPASAELAPYNVFDQDNFFNAKTEAAEPRTLIEKMGMSLDYLGAVARAQGLTAAVHHATDHGLGDFRREAVARLGTWDQYVLVNFLRSIINEKIGGHISPLAAYETKSDRFLILDVSRYKYPPVWVTATDLYAAMNTIAIPEGNITRGYVVLTR
ncbi:MAG: phytochelatin synthase family protein [Dongiaceae bacterium]